MYVKIIKRISGYDCTIWYKDKIGKFFKVKNFDELFYRLIKPVKGSLQYGDGVFIAKCDCKIIENFKKSKTINMFCPKIIPTGELYVCYTGYSKKGVKIQIDSVGGLDEKYKIVPIQIKETIQRG
jgi:hypothetical protein